MQDIAQMLGGAPPARPGKVPAPWQSQVGQTDESAKAERFATEYSERDKHSATGEEAGASLVSQMVADLREAPGVGMLVGAGRAMRSAAAEMPGEATAMPRETGVIRRPASAIPVAQGIPAQASELHPAQEGGAEAQPTGAERRDLRGVVVAPNGQRLETGQRPSAPTPAAPHPAPVPSRVAEPAVSARPDPEVAQPRPGSAQPRPDSARPEPESVWPLAVSARPETLRAAPTKSRPAVIPILRAAPPEGVAQIVAADAALSADPAVEPASETVMRDVAAPERLATALPPGDLAERGGLARVQLVRSVAAQMADGIRLDPSRPVEIRLDPQELGQVRLTLSFGEHGTSIALLAERPETLDLMRRHAELLAAEFQRLGLGDVAFSFAGGREGSPHEGTPGAGTGASGLPDVAAEDVHEASPLRLSLAGGDGLDIRL